MGPHPAPDVQAPDQYIGDNQCVAHAMDVAGQYAAQVHFLGVIAGIYGAEQQKQAVEKIKAAVSDLLKDTGSVLSKANNMANDASLGWGGGLLDGYFAVGEWFERHVMIGGDKMADQTAKLRAEKLSESERAKARERFKRDWNTLQDQIVSYAKKTYEEIKQLCLNGQWKIALCKFGIDLAFAILENAVIAAIAAVTAGAGAVAARVGMTAVKRGEKFVVSLLRKDRPGSVFELGKVEKSEFNEAERRILGSDNQGTTRPDPDRGPAEVAGKDTAPANRWNKKEVNGRTVYQRDDLIDPEKLDGEGRSNLQRMRQGLAPIGSDGHPIELHHMLQQEKTRIDGKPGPLAEVEKKFHSDNYDAIHIYPRSDKDYISWRKLFPEDAKSYDKYRKEYWKTRSKDNTLGVKNE